MTFRPGPLRAAAVLAAGFVGVRVVYRILFHGADGAGAVLLPLPEYRLPSPFSHVVLLGPATVDGVWDAATSALPIALTILAFGVLNAFIDMPRLLARGARRGPLRGIARTLAVAWATLPALADAVRRVRLAARLRGERPGARQLAPVLERTLERATAVAAALELRGLAGRPVEGDCERPVVTRGVVLAHRAPVAHRADSEGHGTARKAPASASLAVADLNLDPGTLTVVTGATGSGKSTLLRAIAGLHVHLDGDTMTGELRVVGHERSSTPPRDTARLVGVVLQNPREGFTADRVADEIGLALDLRGVAGAIVRARVGEIAERIGITHLLNRDVRGLSAGEATLVAVASAIAEHPILLIVDEPLADLDTTYRARIVALLDALAHEVGICVVVAEHRVAELTKVADARIDITDATARPVSVGAVTAPDPIAVRASSARPDVVLRARAITVAHGNTVAVDTASLTLCAGEIVALAGPNGAGKSSLLTALALPRVRGTVHDVTIGDVTIVAGAAHAGDAGTGTVPGTRRGHRRRARRRASRGVALVPDASDDLFICTTVAAECARADRRARVPRGTTAARFADLLGHDWHDELGSYASRHPRDLSVGERRILAIALQLATEPRVLLIDEPTRGLDATACALVARALSRTATAGTAVLMATHAHDFVLALADRTLTMRAGVLNGAGAAGTDGMPVHRGNDTESHQVAASAHRLPEVPSAADHATSHPARESWAGENGIGASAPGLPALMPRAERARFPLVALALANLVALAAFTWPLVAYAVPSDATAAVPAAALALAPVAAIVVLVALDSTVRSAHTLALLGTLAAIGAAVRIVGTGVGGVEAVFILLILAGRAFGPRFGLLLGLLTIALSTMVTGSFGPWTPFQMFACAWVGAGAGLLPRRVTGAAEVAMLCVYGIIASYVFGLIMNLWFWPFAIGGGAGISYEAGAPIGQNLASFLVYSLVTSSLTWDTLRAITTVIGLVVIGSAVLAAFRRAKPVQPAQPTPTPTPTRHVHANDGSTTLERVGD